MTTYTLQSTQKLNTGPTIPLLGFGVWDSPNDLTTKSCLSALKTGYRHIDTAQAYGNESEVEKRADGNFDLTLAMEAHNESVKPTSVGGL